MVMVMLLLLYCLKTWNPRQRITMEKLHGSIVYTGGRREGRVHDIGFYLLNLNSS